DLADQFCQITGHDRVTFCNTGSEAVMGAIRLARLATGRDKIAYFERSYHGLIDAVLADTGAPGLSPAAAGEAVVLPYGDDESLRRIRSVAGELAAVVVEPVQNRNPSVQPARFLAELRRLTAEHGIVLIFDEMITGFRIGLRGAQGHWDITPDLSTYGKVIGGGLPIAAIAGRADLMDGMDGGAWGYGDDSAPTARTTLFGGTFQKHPLAVSAARAVLDHLEAEGPTLYPDLNARAARITDGLTEIFQAEGLPYSIASFGSLWRIEYRGTAGFYQPLPLEMLYYSLLAEGVHVWEGRTFFLSTAHDDRDAEHLLDAVERSVGALRKGGFLPAGERPEWQATPQQRRLWQIQRDHGPEWTAYHETMLLRLRGRLDVAALGQAVRYVLRRHPALTAAFTEDGAALRGDPDIAGELQVADGDDVRTWTEAPFSLDGGPLFRAALLRQGPDLHTLVLLGHHLVLDGVSAGLVLEDLTEAYTRAVRGERLPRAVPPIPALPGGAAGVTPRLPGPHDFSPATRREFGLPHWDDVRRRRDVDVLA
ncbi:aminotransferase class III-fold pyridoxal phosphate-dependent enzyme, partial [Nonomuraea sp. NPDC055795]